MKRHTSPNLQCLLSTYHPIPVFLAGKVGVDGHELQGAVVLVLRHGGQQLGLEVLANQREDWGHVTTCRAVIGHLEVDGGVGHVPAAGRGAPSRGQQGVGGGVHLARAGQPQLGNTVSDVS